MSEDGVASGTEGEVGEELVASSRTIAFGVNRNEVWK
jgi:hypothetical protein